VNGKGEIPASFKPARPLTISRTESFSRDFRNLPKEIQERAEKTILLLAQDPRYPSLRMKKLRVHGGMWEASVSISYRITFRWLGETLILRRIGTHDILKVESR
jgi:mRNA-degrading endonuclease YafQ of YafQ-DinJ toxin-antitoxin module